MNWNPFAKQHREQSVLVATGDRRLVGDSMTVEKNYGVSPKHREAYFMEQNALQREIGSSNSVLVLDERSAIPLYWGLPIKRSDRIKALEANMTAIARENLDQALADIPEKAHQDRMAELIKTIALTLTIALVIMLIVGLALSDKINLPSI